MKKSLCIIGHILSGVAATAGFTAVVMLLWNALLPQIFGIAAIGFWQALGLLVLSRILFGSFGKFHGKHWKPYTHTHFRDKHIREKWMKMTSEERNELIRKCGRHWDGFKHGFFNSEEPGKQD